MGRLDWIRSIRCVVFDWGGTLCRSDRERDAILKGIQAVAEELNIDPAARAAVAASLGKSLQQAYGRCDADPEHRELDVAAIMAGWGEQMGLSSKRHWNLARMVETLWRYWQGCLEPLGRPAPVLEELRRRGYRLSLLSNVAAPPAVCRAELRRLGLLDYFGSCTFSSELGLRKPHRAIFEKALACLADGAHLDPSHVVYVGDSPRWDVGGARAAGLRTVLFRSQVVTWPDEDYQAHRPDAVIDRLDELLILLPRKSAGA